MFHRTGLLLGSSTVAVALLVTTTPEARGGDGVGQKGQRGVAVASPVDCPDVPGHFDRKGSFHPYYSPVIPVSCRWRIVRLTPYYCGYCPPKGPGAGWSGCGLDSVAVAGAGSGDYGPYTGAPRDEAALLHLGGGGTGEGAPRTAGNADFIDLSQGRR